jgi:hypothetical protein
MCPIITKDILQDLWAYLCNNLSSSVKTENDFGSTFQGYDASYKVGNMVTLMSEIIKNSN